MSVLLAVLGAAAATTTGVLLDRYFKRKDEQRDGPPIPDLPDEGGILPAPVQEQPPAAGAAPEAALSVPAVQLPRSFAGFPISPVHGELHKDVLGSYWAFSNPRKLQLPKSRGWAKVRLPRA